MRPTSARAATRTAPASDPSRLEVALARGVLAYLRGVARSCDAVWVNEAGSRLSAADVDRSLAGLERRSQPVVLSYYITDALGVALLALKDGAFIRLMRSLRCLVDETVTGRVSAAMIRSLGGRYVLLPRPGHPDRLRAVHGVMLEGGSCCFPVDGGGPYRRVGTGIIGLTVALHAVVVPLAVALAPAPTLAPRSRVRIPLPRTRMTAVMGDPIEVRGDMDRRDTAAALQRALDRLAAAARGAR